MDFLFGNLLNITWQQIVMWAIGGLLIFLAIKKDMEPTLLLPLGFGTILVNLPFSGAITQMVDGVAEEGALSVLFDAGIANELFPLILFIGIGAMIVYAASHKSETYDFRRVRTVRNILHTLRCFNVFRYKRFGFDRNNRCG